LHRPAQFLDCDCVFYWRLCDVSILRSYHAHISTIWRLHFYRMSTSSSALSNTIAIRHMLRKVLLMRRQVQFNFWYFDHNCDMQVKNVKDFYETVTVFNKDNTALWVWAQIEAKILEQFCHCIFCLQIMRQWRLCRHICGDSHKKVGNRSYSQ